MQNLETGILFPLYAAELESVRAMPPKLHESVHHRIEDLFRCLNILTIQHRIREIHP